MWFSVDRHAILLRWGDMSSIGYRSLSWPIAQAKVSHIGGATVFAAAQIAHVQAA
jgi:hypothetical protein